MEWENFTQVPFEVKTLEEQSDRYEFKGYASIFNIPDKISDIVLPGAFKRTIDHHEGKFPLCWMHDRKMIIGEANVQEDSKGLLVNPGHLIKGVSNAEDAYKLMKAKIINGMSFAFRPIKKTYEGKFRKLVEVAVGEITLGPRNMICHPDALVTSVKFEDQFSAMFARLTEEMFEKKIWEDEEGWTEIRYRKRNPDDFTRIRAWWLKEDSIRALGGPLKGTGATAIQALRFQKKAGWNLDKAKAWIEEHPDLKFHEIIGTVQFAMADSIEEIKNFNPGSTA